NSIGDTIVEMISPNASYGSSETNFFCVTVVNGINEFDTSVLLLYPNPTNGQFTLQSKVDLHNLNIEIVEVSGKIVARIDRKNLTNSEQFLINPSIDNG